MALSAAVLLSVPQLSIGQSVQRVLGLDVSAWQGGISQTVWNNLRNNDNRQFVLIRSSRGGTTGYYDQNDKNNVNGLNTLSQRYDDPYFVQNINRATTAGLFSGSYHFSRPEIVESTLNSGGIRNSGADEADHFIQMAGAWMRPGYIVPIHDLESGETARTDNEMAQFAIDFSERIYAVMGIRPGIYVNGNYCAYVLGGATAALKDTLAKPPALVPSVVAPAYPTLWVASWPNQTDPNSIDVQNGEPKNFFAAFYGPWDDYGTAQPWRFWQYASTAHLPSYSTTANLDVDVARGGIEFLKDQLVPAVWMVDASGEWTTLTNWNSGKTPTAPVTGAGQVTPVASGPLPTPRLPGAIAAGITTGTNDTVILERQNANIVVTISSGTYNVRKLYMRESLNITGGALTVNYVPSTDSTPVSAQFSGPVTLSGSATLQAHTIQVDAAQTFTVSGGTLTFNSIDLMPGTTAAKLLVNGNPAINPLLNATAVIGMGSGSGASGTVDLGGAMRTLTIGNGSSDVDVSVAVPITNGGLTKSGAGTLELAAANTYSGATVLSAGTVLVNNPSGSATGTGTVTVNSGALRGNGTISGQVTVNSGGMIAPGTTAGIGRIALTTPPVFNGTNFMRVNRNGGSPIADKVALSSGTLTYGGKLVISNTGSAMQGGESFSLFSAPAFSGAFAQVIPPALGAGLNWYFGNLAVNGTILVNRQPIAGMVTVTNTPGELLRIPIAALLATASDPDGNAAVFSAVDATSTNGTPVSTDGTDILYQNDLNPVDRFAYTISDGRGGSSTGIVDIVPGPVYAPQIASGPASLTVNVGQDATFAVSATGTKPLYYQWQFNGTDIPLATASTYTRPTVQTAHAGEYRVIVSNLVTSITSTAAVLTVNQPEPNAPAMIDIARLLPDGKFYLHVTASPGHYAIEASTNFFDWLEQTNFITTESWFEYTDENTNHDNLRGYRTRLMQ